MITSTLRTTDFCPQLTLLLQLTLALVCLTGASLLSHAQDVEPSRQSTENKDSADVVDHDVVNPDIAGSVLFQDPHYQPHRFFTFTFQNDIFLNRDFGYTNGIGFTYGKGPFLSFTDNVHPLIERLTRKLYIRKPGKLHGIATVLFQRMQTPEDLSISTPQPDDFPYAGVLALKTILYAYDRDQSDQFSTYLGWVGPASLAGESQSIVHGVTDSEMPRGWDTQIGNEPIFKIEAVRARKLYRHTYADNRGIDVVGIGQLGLGTLSSELLVGAAVRWGSNLEYSHATFSLQPDRQVNSLSLSPSSNFFTYLGVQGGYVANDIFMDGNTFRDGPSVPLRHEYNQVSAGLVFKLGNLAYVIQVTDMNSPSTITEQRQQFGAFSITWNLE